VGAGSARVISGVIKPEYYEGEAYLMIDFGDEASVIKKRKTGLMRWYGLNYALDDRRLVGFTRDISVITDEQYRAAARPTRISRFPDDLLNEKGLEYSGLYEDGWIGDDCYFKLGASRPGQIFSFRGYIPDMPDFRTAGVDLTISINGKPTEVVNLKAGKFTLSRLIKEGSDITSVALHFSNAEVYDKQSDLRRVSAFVEELAINDAPDFASFQQVANAAGEKFAVSGIDADGWMGRSAEFRAPAFGDFEVLKLDLEMPGWSPLASCGLTASVDGRRLRSDSVPRQTFESVYIPLPPGASRLIHLDASAVFPLPHDGRLRSFAVKNIAFESLTQTDLFARGWHRSGYLFDIAGADTDGWVDRRLDLRFPRTTRFREAVVQLVRYPSRLDFPLSVAVNGRAGPARELALEQPCSIRIPLTPSGDTTVALAAEPSFPLQAPDPRSRSYRVVNIDFD
jgi:hypothetical protein